MKRLLVLVLVLFSGSSLVHAAAVPTQHPGNMAAGKLLVFTCHGCHGIPGYRNAYPNYPVPKIAGQHYAYLIAAMDEYRDGQREHPTMHNQASSLSEQDIRNIAAYLSSLRK